MGRRYLSHLNPAEGKKLEKEPHRHSNPTRGKIPLTHFHQMSAFSSAQETGAVPRNSTYDLICEVMLGRLSLTPTGTLNFSDSRANVALYSYSDTLGFDCEVFELDPDAVLSVTLGLQPQWNIIQLKVQLRHFHLAKCNNKNNSHIK